MTRVVVPHVEGMLNPLTTAAVQAEAPKARFVLLDHDDDGAYPRLLNDLWADREDFILVEQDVEPPEGWLAEFDACPNLWCIRGPKGQPGVDWMGCVRFRRKLLKRHYRAAWEAMSIADDGDIPWTWRKIDVRLARVLRGEHVAPCFHTPLCRHHHVRRPWDLIPG
jgi:hypothetical protein